MNEIITKLKRWLSGDISNSDWGRYVVENQPLFESQFSRGVYLKLKNLDRKIGREVLDKVQPCLVCSPLPSIEEAFNLGNNGSFERMKVSKNDSFNFQRNGVTGQIHTGGVRFVVVLLYS